MDERTFDAIARAAAAMPSRRSLLLLGGAGLATALARPATSPAAKKAKKKCQKEKEQCRQAIEDFCAEQEEEPEEECREFLLPCCASCKVKAAVFCVLDVFVPDEPPM